MSAAWEAVAGGAITQEQADLLLVDGFHGMSRPAGRGHHDHSDTHNFDGERPEGGPGGNLDPVQGDDVQCGLSFKIKRSGFTALPV